MARTYEVKEGSHVFYSGPSRGMAQTTYNQRLYKHYWGDSRDTITFKVNGKTERSWGPKDVRPNYFPRGNRR